MSDFRPTKKKSPLIVYRKRLTEKKLREKDATIFSFHSIKKKS